MMDEQKIDGIIKGELRTVNEGYPPYNSLHEAYAILAEEIDEAKEAFGYLKLYTEQYWAIVKKDKMTNSKKQRREKQMLAIFIDRLSDIAKNLIEEAIDIAVVIERTKEFLNGENLCEACLRDGSKIHCPSCIHWKELSNRFMCKYTEDYE